MWSSNFLLIFFITVVASRPQSQPIETKVVTPGPTVEIEKQEVRELFPTDNYELAPVNRHRESQKEIESNTREILEKIAEVNKGQGLQRKKSNPPYIQFPTGFFKSHNVAEEEEYNKESKDLFGNPILEYLKQQSEELKSDTSSTFRQPNIHKFQNNRVMTSIDDNAQVESDNIVPGQYIKRKITHYQSVLVPNPYMNMPMSSGTIPSGFPLASNQAQNEYYQSGEMYPYPGQFLNAPYPLTYPIQSTEIKSQNNMTDFQKQAIAYINTIIKNQNQNFPMLNPNVQSKLDKKFSDSRLNMLIPSLTASINNPDLNNHRQKQAKQNWNWPGAGIFPIFIRDPFLQMYYAVTNMIEYGPNAGAEGPCKLTPRPSRVTSNHKSITNIEQRNIPQMKVDVDKKDGVTEIRMLGNDVSSLIPEMEYLDVENLDVGDEDKIKITLNGPKSVRIESKEISDNIKEEKSSWEKVSQSKERIKYSHLPSGKLDFSSILRKPDPTTTRPPQISNQLLEIQELDEEISESEKADDVSVSNDGSRKLISQDSTGNGIFIHKLRVRQGGVAIAGPGGIATAGSGGTAIVGPNGVAYTHPDGLAIAGSGTKVVAVDPKIDLNEAIKNGVINGTKHVPNTRIGKVVAVGPVIYYNKGI